MDFVLVLHVAGVAHDTQILAPVIERVPVDVIHQLPVPVREPEELAVK